MRESFREIALFMDSVEPAENLRRLLEMHQLEEEDGFAEVWRRHNHTNEITQRFFAFNTFLMDIVGASKPAVEYRDAEIGQYTAENFEICCLSEVWHKEERDDLIDQWNPRPYIAHKSGRAGLTNEVPMLDSAGLVTLSKELEIVRSHFHEYEDESGIDRLSSKGCLLSVFNINAQTSITPNSPSSLNIYSTHLNAAGDAKFSQIFELVEFIWKTMDKVAGDTSRPGRPNLNANILAGDFNLDRHSTHRLSTEDLLARREVKALPEHLRAAIVRNVLINGEVTDERVSEKTGFEILRDLLAVLGFMDLWDTRNGTRGWTSDLTKPGVIDLIARPDLNDTFYCDDNIDLSAIVPLPDPPSAIDHIFVTHTTDVMGYTIDYTRPRRPYTLRPSHPANHSEGIGFLSDHLGISTTLLIVPK